MRRIDWSNPINRSHPLNRGLVGWWLTTPREMGGTTLRDLMGRYDGTLTNMDPATDWVTPGDRRSGWGALDFSGTGDYVDAGIISPWAGATKATLCSWIYRSSLGITVGLGQYENPYRCEFFWYTDDRIYFTASNGADNWPNVLIEETGWHHVCMVFDGTLALTDRIVAYYDGQTKTLTDGGATSPTSLASSANQGSFRMGADSRDWDGRLDDIRAYDRALNAAEVRQLYNLSSTGYPGLLNRQRSVAKAPVAGGTAMPMAWQNYRPRRTG